MKKYNTMTNVGKCRYLINYHDGIKKHEDGSEFFDIAMHGNKKNHYSFIKKLIKEGYKYEQQRL